ncbi:PTS sugar transporter subunit IIA [Actinomyces ruminicola]|uniref:PTS system, N-acetylglucosamine-specific IIA component n=1 Tax=Actinomyces ruminicola TaxID=332524 RepID=A0A1G9WJ12_9ACTO|nr:PTS glucose transporter subunit IIA [Actinomyces ruminicola]SDM84572.1 PTS system, N-acetylglucosamine-specific IIA component [Actinomyces ruminicola]
MSLVVAAPLTGTVVAAADVPDPVFAGGMLGPGLAVDPDRADGGRVTALAPISGRISRLHPHAFIVTDVGGRDVLVHLGLDTVELGGVGFTLHAAEGERVAVGDPVVTWCPTAVEASGRNPIVPIVALHTEASQLTPSAVGARVAAGAPLFTWD